MVWLNAILFFLFDMEHIVPYVFKLHVTDNAQTLTLLLSRATFHTLEVWFLLFGSFINSFPLFQRKTLTKVTYWLLGRQAGYSPEGHDRYVALLEYINQNHANNLRHTIAASQP
ncbi:hypothetical protein KCP74_20440 [Salmonella enterica subsp. enterica]|nr:hypothetical protein KCP74_20440 [Salmonella enterica subsp. enterica]